MKLEATAFRRDGDGTVVKLRIQPGAKRSAVCGMYGEALKVAVKAPPVDGRANAALREFLAEKLGIMQSAVTLQEAVMMPPTVQQETEKTVLPEITELPVREEEPPEVVRMAESEALETAEAAEISQESVQQVRLPSEDMQRLMNSAGQSLRSIR